MRYQNLAITQSTFKGAESTVPTIIKLALEAQNDLSIRELAEKICSGLDEKDYLSEAVAIYNFVKTNVRYMRDPRTKELIKKPTVLVKQLLAGTQPQADCDETSCLIAALLLATGASCRLVTVAFQDLRHAGEQQYTHIFTQAFEPRSKTWVTVDTVAADKSLKMLRQVKFAKVWNIA